MEAEFFYKDFLIFNIEWSEFNESFHDTIREKVLGKAEITFRENSFLIKSTNLDDFARCLVYIGYLQGLRSEGY